MKQTDSASRKRVDNRVQEFVWAYGKESERANRKADNATDRFSS
ncbi:MAG: hypothetical protein ACLRR3_15155 [Eubacterium sp.]